MWNCASISNGARSAWRTFLEFAWPRTCIACGRHLADEPGRFTCAGCRGRIEWIREPYCPSCGIPIHGRIEVARPCPACQEDPPAFGCSRSLFLYRQTGARLVHVLKYEHGTWLQGEIAALLHEAGGLDGHLAGSLLVPVPLHPAKRRRRGYNQAEVVARAICRAFPGAETLPCLERVRMTPSQTFLSRSQRLHNMEGAFHCRILPPPHRRVVVVDDVLTTGATLNAAAAALRAAGVVHISAFTLAHG